MTRHSKGNREIIDRMLGDDDLIDIATTCSNRGVSIAAEIQIRKRYPSKKTSKWLATRERKTVNDGSRKTTSHTTAALAT